MIGVDRGDEPESLRRARYVHLARAELANGAGEPVKFAGYGSAREVLRGAQSSKCAYCEMPQLAAGNPVEHFRPKQRAIRADGSVAPGYWWLAWTWQNLLFSCTTCNSTGRKGGHFGLESGSVGLTPSQQPPGGELQLFVDPSTEDPLDHIVFVKVSHHWKPYARNGSARGQYTIARLGLGHPQLLTLYGEHVERRVWPELELVQAALRSEEASAITRAWSKCRRSLFAPFQQFQGLSHDVLGHEVPPAQRERWRLELPRPGRLTIEVEATDHSPPGLDELPRELALRVRALGVKPGQERWPVLVDLHEHHSDWRAEELAGLLEVSTRTIRADLEQLGLS